MGRLDEAAKRKVVELREAGLSFRKIKAVLELENIKVSAQAIYLFLKEFHGRGRQIGGSPTASGSRDMGLGEPRHGGWGEHQLRNLLCEAAHVAAFSSPSESSGQSGVTPEPRGHSSGAGPASQEPQQGERKDEGVRIVSVTSLAQNTNHDAVQTVRSAGTGAVSGMFSRKRYTPSPANPVLVARKRILDKALFHRARVRDCGPQSSQQTVSLVRRDLSCFPYSEGRKVMLPQTASLNPTSSRLVRGLHPGTNLFRQGFQQRANIPTRPTEQSPRVGIRIPVPGQSSTGPQNASSSVRAQASTSQQQSPPSQQSNVDTGTLSTLQEQVKTLASEVRSLGLAVRMMVEQQGRLEREQSQQTQVQKQILSTLQKLASKQGQCAFQHNTTPTMPPCPLSSASYSQSTFTPSQSTNLCSQAQSRFNEIDGSTLENIEPFSLESLSSVALNGFQTSDSLSFSQTHSPPFTHSHTQTSTSEIVSYSQPNTDIFAGIESKSVEVASPNTDRSFQACRSSTEPASVHNDQLTIVKIESV